MIPCQASEEEDAKSSALSLASLWETFPPARAAHPPDILDLTLWWRDHCERPICILLPEPRNCWCCCCLQGKPPKLVSYPGKFHKLHCTCKHLTAIIFFPKNTNVVRVPPSSKSLSPSVHQERGTKNQNPLLKIRYSRGCYCCFPDHRRSLARSKLGCIKARHQSHN